MLPPWPDWDGLHPFVVHFPVALLLIAPIFVLLGLPPGSRSSAFRATVLILLVSASASILVAMSTGKAAGELADHTPAINAVMTRHVALADATRNLSVALTLLYAALLAIPRYVKAMGRPVAAAVGQVVFLVLLLAAGVLVVQTSHYGGRLVHQLGVHAIMPSDAVER
jgi:uncharacterized membrane protein